MRLRRTSDGPTGFLRSARRPRLPRRRRAPLSLPTALLSSLWTAMLGLTAGMVVLSFFIPVSDAASVVATPTIRIPHSAVGPRTYGPVESAYLPAAPAAPVRLIIPSLHISAPIVPIALASDGNLEPPSDYTEVGWWDGSAEPGSATGQTVITGHSVHYGGGAMDSLPELRHGFIDVVTPQGRVRYRVAKAIVATHAQVAQYSRQLFGQQHQSPNHPARLVLVTCTDYNGSYWENNFIILAQQLGQPRPRGVRIPGARD